MQGFLPAACITLGGPTVVTHRHCAHNAQPGRKWLRPTATASCAPPPTGRPANQIKCYREWCRYVSFLQGCMNGRPGTGPEAGPKNGTGGAGETKRELLLRAAAGRRSEVEASLARRIGQRLHAAVVAEAAAVKAHLRAGRGRWEGRGSEELCAAMQMRTHSACLAAKRCLLAAQSGTLWLGQVGRHAPSGLFPRPGSCDCRRAVQHHGSRAPLGGPQAASRQHPLRHPCPRTFSMFFCLHSSAILAPTMRAASTLLEAASSLASACRISGFSVEEAASVRPASSSITWRQGKAGGAAARRQQAANIRCSGGLDRKGSAEP